jgi:hypothetical protein
MHSFVVCRRRLRSKLVEMRYQLAVKRKNGRDTNATNEFSFDALKLRVKIYHQYFNDSTRVGIISTNRGKLAG